VAQQGIALENPFDPHRVVRRDRIAISAWKFWIVCAATPAVQIIKSGLLPSAAAKRLRLDASGQAI
jgi:hypothetical protein